MLHRILVLICSSDAGGKIVSCWCRNNGQVTHLQDGHQENTSSKVAVPQREPRDMCFKQCRNFPYPRRNDFSTDWPVLSIIVSHKQRCYMQFIQLLPTRHSMSQISHQKNAGQRFTLEGESI